MPAITLFNVAATLQVATIPPFFLTNVTGQGLRVDWTVEKTNTPDPDRAEIQIFNLDLPQRKSLAVAQTSPIPVVVALQIGWEMIPELLFTGQAWKIIPEKRELTDVITMITAGDGAQPTKESPPAGGAVFKAPAQLLFTKILLQLGIPASAAAIALVGLKATQIPITAWQLSFDEPPRQNMDDLMASLGLSWGVSGGFVVVYQNGIRNDVLPVILTPVSGLLTWEELDDGGVNFEALAQVGVVPGGQIKILDPFGQPVGGVSLRVENVTFTGSTMGDSRMSGLARKLQLI